MRIITAIFSISFFAFILIEKTYSNSLDQKCIISNGVPNHEIGQFPTKGNPNKFKKQTMILWRLIES